MPHEQWRGAPAPAAHPRPGALSTARSIGRRGRHARVDGVINTCSTCRRTMDTAPCRARRTAGSKTRTRMMLLAAARPPCSRQRPLAGSLRSASAPRPLRRKRRIAQSRCCRTRGSLPDSRRAVVAYRRHRPRPRCRRRRCHGGNGDGGQPGPHRALRRGLPGQMAALHYQQQCQHRHNCRHRRGRRLRKSHLAGGARTATASVPLAIPALSTAARMPPMRTSSRLSRNVRARHAPSAGCRDRANAPTARRRPRLARARRARPPAAASTTAPPPAAIRAVASTPHRAAIQWHRMPRWRASRARTAVGGSGAASRRRAPPRAPSAAAADAPRVAARIRGIEVSTAPLPADAMRARERER